MLIIHGENQIASRSLYLDTKAVATRAKKDILVLLGSAISLSDLVMALSSMSLLGASNSIFIDGLFARRPSAEKKALIDYLVSHSDSDVTLWEGKDVSSQLKSLSAKYIKRFDLPKYVFQFVDTLTLHSYHQALLASEPEMLLCLIAKRLHDLILLTEHLLSLPAWQQTKLESQAKTFTLPQLISINTQLLDIDFKNKTSASPLDLKSALELWLIKLNNTDNVRQSEYS